MIVSVVAVANALFAAAAAIVRVPSAVGIVTAWLDWLAVNWWHLYYWCCYYCYCYYYYWWRQYFRQHFFVVCTLVAAESPSYEKEKTRISNTVDTNYAAYKHLLEMMYSHYALNMLADCC